MEKDEVIVHSGNSNVRRNDGSVWTLGESIECEHCGSIIGTTKGKMVSPPTGEVPTPSVDPSKLRYDLETGNLIVVGLK